MDRNGAHGMLAFEDEFRWRYRGSHCGSFGSLSGTML
jgi:hypothetical protein